MTGWLKLHRKIQEHWIWQDPVRLKWWMQLLMSAQYKEKKVLKNGQLITVQAGSLLVSEVKLARLFEVGRKTIRKFLALLRKDGMIATTPLGKLGTLIKILNFGKYQSGEPEEHHRDNSKGTAKEQVKVQQNHIGETLDKPNKIKASEDHSRPVKTIDDAVADTTKEQQKEQVKVQKRGQVKGQQKHIGETLDKPNKIKASEDFNRPLETIDDTVADTTKEQQREQVKVQVNNKELKKKEFKKKRKEKLKIRSRVCQSCQSFSADEKQRQDNDENMQQNIKKSSEQIKANINYSVLIASHGQKQIDELVHIIIDTLFTQAKTFRINGEDKPRELVNRHFSELDQNDIEFVLTQFANVSTRIHKKKQYLTTMLYNSRLERGSHFTNLANHDASEKMRTQESSNINTAQQRPAQASRKNRFANYEQHEKDYAEIERLEAEYLLQKIREQQ